MSDMKLIEVGLSDERWSEEAHWAVYGSWDLTAAAEEEAGRLKRQVLAKMTAVAELRAGLVWVNALDREAVETHGADLTQGEQRAERTARRLMHLAARSAYEELKTKRRRQNEIARLACQTFVKSSTITVTKERD